MPKLDYFAIRIKTGESGQEQLPKFSINGFELEFEDVKGSIASGDVFEAIGSPGSFPHSMLLIGPDCGTWDIEEMEIAYFLVGEPPYTLRFAGLTLDDTSDLSIWHPQPDIEFEVE